MYQLTSRILVTLCCLFAFGCASHSASAPEKFSEQVEVARDKIKSGAVVIDVRSLEEFNAGHLAGALHIPVDEIAERLDEVGDDFEKEIVVYCRSGRRASIAVGTLEASGYENVMNAGGFVELSKAIATQ